MLSTSLLQSSSDGDSRETLTPSSDDSSKSCPPRRRKWLSPVFFFMVCSFCAATVAMVLLNTPWFHSVDRASGSDSTINAALTTTVTSTYFSYKRIQLHGIGCPWMTSRTDKKFSCADGSSGYQFNYCIERGTYRTQCPINTKACNDKAANGDAFSCYQNCANHGGNKPCYEPSLSELTKRLKWPFMTSGVVVKTAADGYPDYKGSNNAESCPKKWRVPKTWFMGICPADAKRCTPFSNYSSYVAALREKKGYGDYQCLLYQGDYTNAHGLWTLPRANATTRNYYKNPKRTISRRQILERALGWVTKNWMYINIHPHYTPPFPTRMWVNGKYEVLSTVTKRREALNCVEACYDGQSDGCPQVWHGCDCCGLVAMSWRIADCGRTPSTSLRIKCQDIKPGDAISDSATGITAWKGAPTACNKKICPWGSHIVLFRRWIGKKCYIGSKFEIYQSGGGGAKMNVHIGGFLGAWHPQKYYAMRRVNLEDP